MRPRCSPESKAPAPSITSPGPVPTPISWSGRRGSAGPVATSPEVLDRDYFKSIYFREPRGVLFEIATLSPGFAVDEDPDHLGEQLRLPRQHQHLRPQLERLLTAVENPRVIRRQSVGA
jgi:glyoxalase family protein